LRRLASEATREASGGLLQKRKRRAREKYERERERERERESVR
jgi:hypothetical protein